MTAAEGPVYDVGVIGSGMAGMSAALFAAGRGLSTVLIGRTGEIIFATGLLDLMGVHPVETGRTWSDPFAGIAALVADHPRHPYARVPADEIRAAFDEVLALLEAAGLPYAGREGRNAVVPTLAGTCKLTYRVPRTMWAGAAALERREPVLLLDIPGLKGFSARQVAGAFASGGAEVRTAAIELAERPTGGDVFTERLARGLEHPAGRERFAAAIAARLRGEAAVGVPAVLGVSASAGVMDELRARIGRPLFEIPTMPPGVTGLRLKEAFERGLAGRGVRLHLDSRVFGVAAEPGGGFRLAAGRLEPEGTIRAAALILATGRFMGGGLRADRGRVRESLFDLPVFQPPARDGWHREEFLDPRGHPVNAAGIETDEAFRPLAGAGRVRHHRLFAAGSILAHQDWMRTKCGAGIALATARAAVRHAAAALGRTSGSD
jgi:glycerol-3-phosphate dehydrogenase subunit B